MKKTILALLIFSIFVGLTVQKVLAQDQMEINFFYSSTCPHCKEEKVFLDELRERYPDISIKEYEIAYRSENREVLIGFYQEYQVPEEEWGIVPIIFTPNKYFVGFNEQIGENIESCLRECFGVEENTENPSKIELPILGEISIARFSPLALAVIMGTLDGFNACAMVALGFLLTVLISTGVRERVFWIGGTFILVSGVVYFIFIAASLNLFLVLEKINFITNAVGVVIIAFAVFLLKDYFHGVICKMCEVSSAENNIFAKWEKKMFGKMQELSSSKKSLAIVLFGVAAVAAGINLVELVCSFGFPLAFTKMLTSLELGGISYYLYLLVYIIFYMIDDFIIFMLAVTTLRITQVSQGYLKAIKLISAVLLLILGFIMMIRPEILSLM